MKKIRNISVVIPHYQKQKALEVTWKELQLQLSPGDNIYIVDDHSPDGVPEFDCDCTKVVRPEKHEPHIYRLNTLRNTGVKHASNDAVVILDPDCIPNPRFLDHARRVYDPSVLYAGWINYLDKDGSLLKEDPRKANGASRWCDRVNRSCGMVWGGCMYFSKSRASLIGLFDEEFDGHWGAEDHVFASACRNSGMRLRYEKGLTVSHQWHPKHHYGNQQRNIKLFRKKIEEHREHLNLLTPYSPAVAVLCVTMMRPYYIDQVMRSVFRSLIPLKVKLVNNGDRSQLQRKTLEWWSDRWAVDYVEYKDEKLLSEIRTEAMREYKSKGYKYLILIDDDITPMMGSIVTLVKEMETHKQFHAMAGWIMDWNERRRFIGGSIRNQKHYYYYPVRPTTMEADYISSGFTIHRLNKVVPYSDGWEMGWADWDWSHEANKAKCRLAVTGKAGAYHRYLFTSKGKEYKQDPDVYRSKRRDKARHDRMASRYMDKWGYWPSAPRPETKMML